MLKKAYLLMIHKNPDQVNCLLKQLLTDEYTDIYIHINKLNRNIENQLLKHKNINVLKECVEVYWGDVGITNAMLLLLNAVVNSGKQYDFVSFKTGQDLIINGGIDTFLLHNKNKIFMDVRHIPKNDIRYAHIAIKWPNFTKRLYDGLQPERIIRLTLLKLYKIGINFIPNPYKLPNDYKLYWGRTWFTIPFEVVNYIVDFVKENPWYYKIFQNGLVSDELFFQTIIMNSAYSNNVVNDNLTCVNKFKNNHPIIFTENDIEYLENSNKFFARKFDISVNEKSVMYFMEKALKN
jgi:hypothetical protein